MGERDHAQNPRASRVGDEAHGLVLTSVAVTAHPARVNAKSITILPGELDHKLAADRWQLRAFDRELLTRAAMSHVERRRSRGPIVVHDQQLAVERERVMRKRNMSEREIALALIEDEERRPPGPLRHWPRVPARFSASGRRYPLECSDDA